jgi:DNA-binding GntR family transcriptional regulator
VQKKLQEVSVKILMLSKQAKSLYDRLLQLQRLRNTENGRLSLEYRSLSREFKVGREQLRRYFVKLETAGLIERHYMVSNINKKTTMYIQFLEKKAETPNKKGAAR